MTRANTQTRIVVCDTQRLADGCNACGDAHLSKVVCQVVQDLFLCLLLSEHGGHLGPQMTHEQDVDLGGTHTLHKLVDLAVTAAQRVRKRMKRFSYENIICVLFREMVKSEAHHASQSLVWIIGGAGGGPEQHVCSTVRNASQADLLMWSQLSEPREFASSK